MEVVEQMEPQEVTVPMGLEEGMELPEGRITVSGVQEEIYFKSVLNRRVV